VLELASVTPHADGAERFTAETWIAYSRGYYVALCYAVKVMQLARARRAIRLRLQREIAAQQLGPRRAGTPPR
jgi:hypothetical protein